MEVWKEVKEFPGRYWVSNHARVKSDRKILVQSLNNRGYPFVVFSIHCHNYSRTVHRLVATAFIPKPVGKDIINHINGVKTDNRIENLEWCTYKENAQHARSTGLSYYLHGRVHPNTAKTHCIHGHEFTQENTYLKPTGGRGCKRCMRQRTVLYRRKLKENE